MQLSYALYLAEYRPKQTTMISFYFERGLRVDPTNAAIIKAYTEWKERLAAKAQEAKSTPTLLKRISMDKKPGHKRKKGGKDEKPKEDKGK